MTKTKYEESYHEIDTNPIIYYTRKVYPYIITEECHGVHYMNQSLTELTLDSIEVVIKGEVIDILPLLSDKQKAGIVRDINEGV